MADILPDTYLYRFSYDLPGQPLGTFYSNEFFMGFRQPGPFTDPTSGTVSETTMGLRVRFAKTGDPNGGMNVSWSKYTRDEGSYLDIGEVPVMKSGY